MLKNAENHRSKPMNRETTAVPKPFEISDEEVDQYQADGVLLLRAPFVVAIKWSSLSQRWVKPQTT